MKILKLMVAILIFNLSDLNFIFAESYSLKSVIRISQSIDTKQLKEAADKLSHYEVLTHACRRQLSINELPVDCYKLFQISNESITQQFDITRDQLNEICGNIPPERFSNLNNRDLQALDVGCRERVESYLKVFNYKNGKEFED